MTTYASRIMPTYGRLPVSFSRGAGELLFDGDDRPYIDGVSGIAVTNLGHCHPAVTKAITAQAGALVHTSNLYRIDTQEALAATLTDATGMDNVFFCNSGAEGNETAIKLARQYGAQKGIEHPGIVVLEAAFHGRTMAALSATGNEKLQLGFGPMLEGFYRVARDDIEAISRLAEAHANIVAVLVEPIQGEGGVYPLPVEYLKQLRAICDQHQWLLMFDEVQCGNGRCGSLYAFQRIGVTPDVLVTAKGLGNGVPIGACMARGDAAEVMAPGHHGTTYGGNPLACSAAQAVVDTLIGEQLWDRADPIRAAVLEGFRERLAEPGWVREVRGTGLMIGIELTLPCDGLVQCGLDQGVLLNVTAGRTVRLLPPLVMSDENARVLGGGVAEAIGAMMARQTQTKGA
ncbi:acetylornithine aminotransferase 1 [Luminiphilus syltensis NOR5-1B]|uniref:Acetylornithine aminotransferase 1 n=1 Tax=Luminiphilus syltensis NOR5-1B TaxID=565045 RepID=B8KSM8_9GAMM|nr:aspartate aminotransferase family protein [Luminiphilus syltensis]EED34889.1 acetylornithine aminotransferase 1 [Luminiphilus syltensis NOR5-1B]